MADALKTADAGGAAFPPAISVVDGSVAFGNIRALEDINLSVESGDFITILGPSGCGKSTLLRLISDLVPPTTGEVRVLGKTTEEARLGRQFSFVFQQAGLLPWRTVIDNVRLPLEMGRRSGGNIQAGSRSPEELLAMLGLEGREGAWPHELSGGMQQRVAIARALVCQPTLLLMDEPFGALDEMTRDKLNLLLLEIWRQTGVTILFVTHSIPEAVLLARKVVMMTANPGRIRKVVDIELPDKRTLVLRDTPKFTKFTAQLRRLLGDQQ